MIKWSKRNCSIMGKICLVKSLLIPQLTHALQALIIPEKIICKLNSMFFRFIWKKRFSNTKAYEKVKRKVMCQETSKGGLNMIDLGDFQKSFVLGWFSKLLQPNEEAWKSIPLSMFSKLGKNLCCFQANVKPALFKGLGLITNKFWKSVLECWLDNHEKILPCVKKMTQLENVCLWNNSLIAYRGKTMFLRDWVTSDICYVKDLYENNMFLPFHRICERVGHKPTRLFEYGAIRTAIASLFLKMNDNGIQAMKVMDYQKISTFKPRQFRKLMVDAYQTETIAVSFWKRKMGIEINKDIWQIASNASKEVRLRLLHWKITHNIYPTNIILYKMGITESISCTHCTEETDYIEHFFYYCIKISKVWNLVEEAFFTACSKRIHVDVRDALFGLVKRNSISSAEANYVNLLILIAKMCIGIYRYGTPLEIGCIFEKELSLRND
eukprot:GHVL01029953.1.p1 GENE.GHVL01029953.1~~GHVL01029953.1.p1  ORF type:complete len:439 (+),score=22.22 GHVL01029953.1:1286-2602(+)